MEYPKLKAIACTRRTLDVFRGCNRSAGIGAGEFRQMENLTSDHYPQLAPRRGRSFYRRPASPQGIIAKDTVCYVDGADFVAGDRVVPMGLSVAEQDCPKQLVSMGAYVIILPDNMYINTRDLTDFGSIEAEVTAAGITAEKAQEGLVVLRASGIGSGFRAGDAVEVTGFSEEALNGSLILKDCAADALTVEAQIGADFVQEGSVTIRRSMPRLDFACESGNRLWGCRYGPDRDGRFVNEIYASALGDFKNWNRFEGLSTDSYAVSCGTDGPFTGAVSYLGSPLFFKEKGIHRVYGSYPAAFRMQDTACRGVQEGCARSIALVDETLFYKARSGICAYDGSLPVCVSGALGEELFTDAAAGSAGGKYYASMKDESGAWHLFVFDSRRALWHREDSFHASAFCTLAGQLYAVDAEKCDILCLTGGGEEQVRWMAQTGELGLEQAENKYVSRLLVRVMLECGAKLVLSVSYDGAEDFEPLCTVFGTQLRSFSVPVPLRRCDSYRLRFEGEGQGKVYAVTEFVQAGGDL